MRVKLTIGDWSQDGHSVYEEFVYESNKPLVEIQQAYRDSCKLTKVQFNGNQDYTGLNLDWKHHEYDDRRIYVKYESDKMSKLAFDILSKHMELDEKYRERIYEEDYIDLIIDFIKLSLPDLELEEAAFKKSELEKIPAINGWWGKLNHPFGYGLYE